MMKQTQAKMPMTKVRIRIDFILALDISMAVSRSFSLLAFTPLCFMWVPPWVPSSGFQKFVGFVEHTKTLLRSHTFIT